MDVGWPSGFDPRLSSEVQIQGLTLSADPSFGSEVRIQGVAGADAILKTAKA